MYNYGTVYWGGGGRGSGTVSLLRALPVVTRGHTASSTQSVSVREEAPRLDTANAQCRNGYESSGHSMHSVAMIVNMGSGWRVKGEL